jgi:hypothetical protein
VGATVVGEAPVAQVVVMRVHLKIHRSATRWPRKRAQRWWFTIEVGVQVVATSETYTNHHDCRTAALNLFTSPEVDLYDELDRSVFTVREDRPKRTTRGRKSPDAG